MGIGISLLLVAVGAVLIWGVNMTVSGVDINVVGWIVLIVGVIGALLALMLRPPWGRGDRERAYVDR